MSIDSTILIRNGFKPSVRNDELVKSRFSLPWREGIKGRGEITFKNTATYHPHPNPPPSMGRGFRTFYEVVRNPL